jgi:hypothetical protein
MLHRFGQSVVFLVTATALNCAIAGEFQSAKAAVLALSDDNSVAAFDPDPATNPINTGLLFWTVDDVNHLFQNQFWYRVGSTGGESFLNTLNLLSINQSDPTGNKFGLTYGGNGFEIGINFRLDGGSLGSGIASLFEDITIKNTSNTALDFHLFNYTDFDLTEDGSQDTTVINNRRARQSNNFTFTTDVVKPIATSYQVGSFGELLATLTDNSPTNLNNFSGGITGDNSYAFQWDFTLNSESSYTISNYKTIAPISSVPEPITLIGSLSFGAFMWLRRRSSQRF